MKITTGRTSAGGSFAQTDTVRVVTYANAGYRVDVYLDSIGGWWVEADADEVDKVTETLLVHHARKAEQE